MTVNVGVYDSGCIWRNLDSRNEKQLADTSNLATFYGFAFYILYYTL